MQSGYYDVTGGMVTQFNRLDMISQNLANVRTDGYKQKNAIFGDYLRLAQDSRDELPLANQTREAARFVNRTVNRVPRMVEEYTDFSMGPMERTDNPLDLALSQENLFFAVETPSGIRLTRNGAFNLNEKGELVTKEGYKVLSSSYFKSGQGVTIPETALKVTVDRDGKVEILEQTAMDAPQQSDELMIVSVDNPQDLKAEGDNLFAMPGKDLAKEMRPVQNSGAVRQFTLEKSNVNPVMEMTELIETNRLVEMYQKVMRTQMDDMNQDAINKLASLKA
ncbi:MAG: flagellar hook-basal body protein [Epsilonproteobacteria bacterium]|nr:flagellar hook-basal body protein [Campylobacterota bacterium]